MSQPKELIRHLVVDEPCWLHAEWKGLTLTVKRSIGLRDNDPIYRVVLDLLRASPNELVESFEVLDASMMFGKVQVSVWRFDV